MDCGAARSAVMLRHSMTAPDQPSNEFLSAFRGYADANGEMTFERFMELALYHPQIGYYRKNRSRVGYGRGTDFFTASTSGPIFGEIIAAACATLVGTHRLEEFTFVEIGAEPDGGVMKGVTHPFANVRTLRVGDPLEISGRCIVFSNELFDAQPFRRFIARAGHWREIGVKLQGPSLVFTERDTAIPPRDLPASPPDGYVIDAPVAATALARTIASQAWSGLFLAFDYGKIWRELIEACPAGTARAYFRHTQSNDLLARPGEQDLTCHVCWDWLAEALREHGFASPQVESQELFFVRHAGDFLAACTAAEAPHFSRRKLALLQLLHPAHLGQKFQVLHAWRD